MKLDSAFTTITDSTNKLYFVAFGPDNTTYVAFRKAGRAIGWGTGTIDRPQRHRLNGTGALGLRWRLLPRGSRLRLDLRAEYRGSMIYTIVTRDAQTLTGRALRTGFGQFDIFHGPQLAIRGAL